LARVDLSSSCGHISDLSAGLIRLCASFFFLLTAPASPENYALSLHDALPIMEYADKGSNLVINGIEVVQGASEPTYVTSNIHDADRKSTRLNSSHVSISYAVFCLKQKK